MLIKLKMTCHDGFSDFSGPLELGSFLYFERMLGKKFKYVSVGAQIREQLVLLEEEKENHVSRESTGVPACVKACLVQKRKGEAFRWKRRTCSSTRCRSAAQACATLRPHGLRHTRFPRPSLPPGVCSNSCPLSQRCHPIISFSVSPCSSCPQFVPASGSSLLSQLLASVGQSVISWVVCNM